MYQIFRNGLPHIKQLLTIKTHAISTGRIHSAMKDQTSSKYAVMQVNGYQVIITSSELSCLSKRLPYILCGYLLSAHTN